MMDVNGIYVAVLLKHMVNVMLVLWAVGAVLRNEYGN